MIKDPNVRSEALKLLEENTHKAHQNTVRGNDFLKSTPKAQEIIKFKISYTSKATTISIARWSVELKKKTTQDNRHW